MVLIFVDFEHFKILALCVIDFTNLICVFF